MDYAFIHEGKAYTPNQTPLSADDADAHNDAIEAQDLATWKTRPGQFYCYASDRNTVTTWRGVILGRITYSNTVRNNLTGESLRYIRVTGNNGATYRGAYSSDNGQLVRLKKCKKS
jgi:hypothetical protein